MIPEIKICGITKPEEINILNELSIDYVGFVFAKSKRQVSIKQASNLKAELNSSIKTVAVVVNETIDCIKELESAGFDILQYHGNINNELISNITIPVWNAISITKPLTSEFVFNHQKIIGYVLDGAVSGSGETFDWSYIKDSNLYSKKLILAGGLNINNITTAIKEVTPDVVDVSSSVESVNGKDDNKIINFVRKVKSIEIE